MWTPARWSSSPASGMATTKATAACAMAAPRMPPVFAPIHRAGSRAAPQVRFSQMVTLVLPSPVWMSKTSAVTMRATVTKARNSRALADSHPVGAVEEADQRRRQRHHHRGDRGHERHQHRQGALDADGEGVRLPLGETGERRDRHVADGGPDQAGDPAGDVVGQEVEAQLVGPEHVAHDDRVGEQHDGLEAQADGQRDAEDEQAPGHDPVEPEAEREVRHPQHQDRDDHRLGECAEDEAVGAGARDREGQADDRVGDEAGRDRLHQLVLLEAALDHPHRDGGDAVDHDRQGHQPHQRRGVGAPGGSRQDRGADPEERVPRRG